MCITTDVVIIPEVLTTSLATSLAARDLKPCQKRRFRLDPAKHSGRKIVWWGHTSTRCVRVYLTYNPMPFILTDLTVVYRFRIRIRAIDVLGFRVRSECRCSAVADRL